MHFWWFETFSYHILIYITNAHKQSWYNDNKVYQVLCWMMDTIGNNLSCHTLLDWKHNLIVASILIKSFLLPSTSSPCSHWYLYWHHGAPLGWFGHHTHSGLELQAASLAPQSFRIMEKSVPGIFFWKPLNSSPKPLLTNFRWVSTHHFPGGVVVNFGQNGSSAAEIWATTSSSCRDFIKKTFDPEVSWFS